MYVYIYGCEYIYIYGNPHGMVQFLCYPSPMEANSLQATCRRIQIRLRRISTMAMRTEPGHLNRGKAAGDGSGDGWWSNGGGNKMWVCLKMLCTPKPNRFHDHYPVFKWLFHWEYTQHFQTNPCVAVELWSYIWPTCDKYDQICKHREISSELDKSDNLDMVPGCSWLQRTSQKLRKYTSKGVVSCGVHWSKVNSTHKVIWPVKYCAQNPWSAWCV